MTVSEKIELLPHSPGVYRYYDDKGTVIYVGKAKDLYKRVHQYFVDPQRLTVKTRLLVARIADVQYSVVDTEADALLLENNLIKQYKPRYNILLKDSKTYPWICVTSEMFPRVYLTRRVEKNGSRYFGPYSSVFHARSLLEFFTRNWPLRSCRLKIDSEAILRGKYRPCLDYHIGRCAGCCIGKVSQEEYNGWIEEIVHLLKGGVSEIISKYKQAMEQAAEALDFETAQFCKTRMEALQRHYAKSIIRELEGTHLDRHEELLKQIDAKDSIIQNFVKNLVFFMQTSIDASEKDSPKVIRQRIKDTIGNVVTKEFWTELRAYLDKNDNIISNIALNPKITESDLHFIELSCCGFSYIEIAITMGYSPNYISTKRKEIAKKLGINIPLQDYISQLLQDHSQQGR